MSAIDNSFQFIFKMNPNSQLIINKELLIKINKNDFSELQKNNISLKYKGIEFFELIFEEKEKLTIFRYAVECKFKDLPNSINIVSYEHLKIILKKKIQEKIYKNPFFYSRSTRKNVFIDVDKIEDTQINVEKFIEIFDKDIKDDLSIIQNIFKEQEEMPYFSFCLNF